VLVPDRILLPFKTLVDQCWGILKGILGATFPTTTPAHPSRYVLVQPGMTSWPGNFWKDIVVPTMANLLAHPPPYVDRWFNPMARSLVEAYLRQTLQGSPWLTLMDFTR